MGAAGGAKVLQEAAANTGAKSPLARPTTEIIPEHAPIIAPEAAPVMAAHPETAPVVAAHPEVAPVVAAHPEAAPVVATHPEVAPVVAAHPEVAPVVAAHPETAPVVAAHPEVAPKVAAVPELAPVVAAAPELAPIVATAPESPVGKVMKAVAAEGPVVEAQPAKPAQAPTNGVVGPAVKMTPEELFAKAKAANDHPRPETAAKLSEQLPEILEAQKAATLGVDPELQARRETFERALALDDQNPQKNPGVQKNLDAMCEKALDYVMKMNATPEEQAAALKRLGKNPDSGYAGAVGTDPETVLAVLKGGNARERMVTLGEFQTMLGDDALKPGGLDRMREVFGKAPGGAEAAQGPATFGLAEIDRLAPRVQQYEKEQPIVVKRNAKGLFSPLERLTSTGLSRCPQLQWGLPRNELCIYNGRLADAKLTLPHPDMETAPQ